MAIRSFLNLTKKTDASYFHNKTKDTLDTSIVFVTYTHTLKRKKKGGNHWKKANSCFDGHVFAYWCDWLYNFMRCRFLFFFLTLIEINDNKKKERNCFYMIFLYSHTHLNLAMNDDNKLVLVEIEKWGQKDLLFFTYNTFWRSKMWNPSHCWLRQYLHSFDEKEKRLFAIVVYIWWLSVDIFNLVCMSNNLRQCFIFFFFFDDLPRLINVSKVTIKINVP